MSRSGAPRRRAPFLVGSAVLVVVLALVVLAIIRPTVHWDRVTAPTSGLGPLGRELAAVGYSCTEELTDPLISGCYTTGSEESRFVRWQGPGDEPAALYVHFYDGSLSRDLPGDIDRLLTAMLRSRAWTSDDVAAVRTQVGRSSSVIRSANLSWGHVIFNASDSSLSLSGVRTGEAARAVTAQTFPTALADVERAAAARGHPCDRRPSTSGDGRSFSGCPDREGNEILIEADATLTVTGLSARSVSPAGLSADFAAVVAAAAPTDAAALTTLITEGAAAPTSFHRAANGWLVVCARIEAFHCGVSGVSWDPQRGW